MIYSSNEREHLAALQLEEDYEPIVNRDDDEDESTWDPSAYAQAMKDIYEDERAWVID